MNRIRAPVTLKNYIFDLVCLYLSKYVRPTWELIRSSLISRTLYTVTINLSSIIDNVYTSRMMFIYMLYILVCLHTKGSPEREAINRGNNIKAYLFFRCIMIIAQSYVWGVNCTLFIQSNMIGQNCTDEKHMWSDLQMELNDFHSKRGRDWGVELNLKIRTTINLYVVKTR